MNKILVVVFVLVFTGSLFAQIDSSEVYTSLKVMPVFGDGDCQYLANEKEIQDCSSAALREFIQSIDYPKKAKKKQIEGRVFIEFIIDQDGKTIEVKLARGTDPILDEAALKHVESMPLWKPGELEGEKVKLILLVPIDFKLED